MKDFNHINPLIKKLGYDVPHVCLFEDIKNYKEIGKVKDNLNNFVRSISQKIPSTRGRHNLHSLENDGFISLERNSSEVKIEKSFMIDGIDEYSGLLDIKAPVAFEKNVTISRAVFDAPTYVCEGARIEYSSFQDNRSYNYVGKNSVVSNTPEVRGTFVGNNCYVHALNTGNMIIGDNSKIGRCHVQNHPITEGNATIIDVDDLEIIETDSRHLATFIGSDVEIIGYGSVLTGGTVVGQGCSIDHNQNIDGMVWKVGKTMNYKSKHPELKIKRI